VSDTSFGVYVHVPWCRVRCPYCAFYVVADRGVLAAAGRYVDAILAEYAARSSDFTGTPSTVFLGGGTPSRLPVAELRRLLDGIPRQGGAELEANPEDVDAEWLAAATAAGVDRISLGIQTLDPTLSKRLGRAASTKEAQGAIRRVAESGVRSWSVDVMFALPGQSFEGFAADLDDVLAFSPPHVSVYGLTIEPETAFERLSHEGKLAVPDDDEWRRMYDHLVARLSSAGLERYEVSNFARPGHESAHNQGYWHGRPYLGLGPGAHGLRPDGSRYANAPDLAAWLRGERPTTSEEPADPERIARDALISGMRAREGVDLAELTRATGYRVAPTVVEALLRHGLLAENGARIALCGEGWPLADAVVAKLVGGVGPVGSS
jgi:oxygen-independent coproporphyrinogen-3 oxidase